MKNTSKWDKRGLISEALAMEGLTAYEYRSIFFDWAFGLENPESAGEAAKELLALHKTDDNADHEIIRLLEDAVKTPKHDGRRKGRARRTALQ